MQGFQRALAAGATEVAVFTAASEAFCQKNTNCSIAESLQRIEEVVAAAKDANVAVRGYVSCVVGCPYQVELTACAFSEGLVANDCYLLICRVDTDIAKGVALHSLHLAMLHTPAI